MTRWKARPTRRIAASPRCLPMNCAPTGRPAAVKATGSGKPVPLDLGKWGSKAHTSDPVWAPDSKRLALRTVSPNLKEQQLLVIDPATGKSRSVAEDKDPAWVFCRKGREMYFRIFN